MRTDEIWRRTDSALCFDLTFVICDTVAADSIDDVAESFDLGDKGVDILFRNFEILVVLSGLDIGTLQQIEKTFLLIGVARENFRQLQRVRFALLDQKIQTVLFIAI